MTIFYCIIIVWVMICLYDFLRMHSHKYLDRNDYAQIEIRLQSQSREISNVYREVDILRSRISILSSNLETVQSLNEEYGTLLGEIANGIEQAAMNTTFRPSPRLRELIVAFQRDQAMGGADRALRETLYRHVGEENSQDTRDTIARELTERLTRSRLSVRNGLSDTPISVEVRPDPMDNSRIIVDVTETGALTMQTMPLSFGTGRHDSPGDRRLDPNI